MSTFTHHRTTYTSNNYTSHEKAPSFFHYIVPATRSNKNLCRLLLSETALNFPFPILINWGVEEDPDPYKVHMQKVHGIFAYLDGFAPDRQDDLVIILDGYDVWLQLPPEVIIKRYYNIIDAANERLRQSLGSLTMQEHNIYQSIIFGADKICWPEDPTRFACWAVADSTLPRWAFGPETDSGKWRHLNRPRWLNSGTIIGPLGDIRTLFKATLDRISTNYTVDSDQLYFSDIFGIQEHARRKLANDLPTDMMQYRWLPDGWNGEGHMQWIQLHQPSMLDGQRSEYHVTIDYESQLFQTVAYYDHFISWSNFDGTFPTERLPGDNLGRSKAMLPEDILAASPPFAIPGLSESSHFKADASSNTSWEDLSLGFNTASNQVFAAIHFTPPKHFRELWWERMWYAPYAKPIIRSARPSYDTPYLTSSDGREWWPFAPPEDDSRHWPPSRSRAGAAYSDKGQWLDWTELCGKHEDAVFYNAPEQGDVPIPDWRDLWASASTGQQ